MFKNNNQLAGRIAGNNQPVANYSNSKWRWHYWQQLTSGNKKQLTEAVTVVWATAWLAVTVTAIANNTNQH